MYQLKLAAYIKISLRDRMILNIVKKNTRLAVKVTRDTNERAYLVNRYGTASNNHA